MPPQSSKTVFVANVPFDVSEEELANVFSEAGPVANVEIKFDPTTGRSKGYAFVQYHDEPTAASAVRNLASVEVHGRSLRVELSTDEPGPRRGAGGGAGGGGGGSGPTRQGGPGGHAGRGGRNDTPPHQFRRDDGPGGYGPPPSGAGPGPGPGGPPPPVDLGLLPPGTEAYGVKATDAISKTLAAVSPGQMQDVMAGMKTLIETQPDQARQLLQSKPQLAYALFQAMLLMNIVDASVLQRIQPLPSQNAPQSYGGAPNYNAPPQHAPGPAGGGYPAAQAPYGGGGGGGPGGYRPPPGQGQGHYGAPPPQQQPPQTGLAALPQHVQAALSSLEPAQRDQLVQVLQLSQSQVDGLDPQQRASVMQLRQQFLGVA